MTKQSPVPATRIRVMNDAPVHPEGQYVLYWMVAARRVGWNFALDRALEHGRRLQRPVLIFEALRVDYPWASERHHSFALDGMAANARRLRGSPVGYFPYVEAAPGAGKGLLKALAARAALVVTDEYPCFFLPSMLASAARQLPVRLEAVDSNGLMPLGEIPQAFSAAYGFRRFLQKALPDHLVQTPSADPLRGIHLPDADPIDGDILARWPAAPAELLARSSRRLDSLPIDRSVAPTGLPGGAAAASDRLDHFVAERLDRYAEDRNHPDEDVASGLSPYLHWGHLSPHEVFHRIMEAEGWSPIRLSEVADGRREGWWGVGRSAEAFLDQLVTWRELGFAFCHHRPDYAEYDSLPDWAVATLEDHASDPRPRLYSLDELASAATDDAVWNAAQRQLVEEGVIQNYLRMLWGKKILEWTAHPREALRVMIELNDRYALDGRDPNSYSGIFWILGRFDRGWPERSIFGKVRCMTSDSTRRKLRLKVYLDRWGARQS